MTITTHHTIAQNTHVHPVQYLAYINVKRIRPLYNIHKAQFSVSNITKFSVQDPLANYKALNKSSMPLQKHQYVHTTRSKMLV